MRARDHRRYGRLSVARAAKASIEALEQRMMLAGQLDALPAPILIAECDTGSSQSDGITSYNSSDGRALLFDVAGAKPNAEVQILLADSHTVLGDAKADDSGFARISLRLRSGVFADATYGFLARQELGTVSEISQITSITIDTTAPTPAIALDPASDSGFSNSDSVTNITTPTFDLSGVLDSHRIYLDGTLVASGATVSTWTSPSLADGSHVVRVEAEDLAGNIGQSSTMITIDTAAPAAPAIDLADDSYDTGISNTDRITISTSAPILVVAPDLRYQLWVDGVQVSGESVDVTPYEVSGLAEGTHIISAYSVDAAGNRSAVAAEMTLTVDAQAPDMPESATLLPSDATGYVERFTNKSTFSFQIDTSKALYYRVYDYRASLISGLWETSSTFTVSNVADGYQTYSISAVDAAGNVSSSFYFHVIVDTMIPAPPTVDLATNDDDTGISNTDRITNRSSVLISAVAPEFYYQLWVDDVQVGPDMISSRPWGISGLANGEHVIRAYSVDPAGNRSAAATMTLTVDTVAPAAPVAPDLDASADSGLSNTDNITKLSNLLFNISASPYYRVYENGFQIGADYATSATFLRTLTTEGTRGYIVRAVDAAGNLSPESGATQVTYDRTAPLSQSPLLLQGNDTGISSTDWITKINTPTITTLGNSAYQLYVDSVLVGTYSAGQDATLSTLSNGTHSITMYAMDVAGNLAAGVSRSVTIDTIAPVSATLSLRSTDDSGISSTDGVTNMTTPTFLLSSTNYFILQKDGVDLFSAYTYASSYRVNYLNDGTYAFTARLSDVAGNTVTTNAVTVSIDTLPPGAPAAPDLDSASDSGSSNTDNITNDNTPTLLLPGGGDRYRVLRGSTILTSWITGASVTLGTQSDGTFAYTLQTMDAAGNISSSSPGLSITIDTIAPTVPAPTLTAASDSGVSSSDRITNVQSPVFNISALVGLGDVTMLLDGLPISVDWSNPSLQLGGMPDGSHTLTSRRPDVAGNLGANSTSFTIDTVAPPAPPAPDLQAGSDDGVSNTDDFTSIQSPVFSVSAGSYFVFVHDGAQVGGNYLTGSSYALWKIGAGTHSAAVRSRDVAGNTSMPSPGLTYTIYAAPPVLVYECDSGSSGTDGVTNYNNAPGKELVFAIRGAAPGDTLRLYLDDLLARTVTASDTTGFVYLSPGAMADGVHTITASRTPAGGGAEVMLGDGTFVIDTVAPMAPGMPDLAPAYDTGISDSDNITNNISPKIHVDATEEDVYLKAAGRSPFAIVNGETTLPYLIRGANLLAAYSQDLAGNESYGPSLTITYDAFAPMKPSTPALSSASGTQLVLNVLPAASAATAWSVEWAPSTVNVTDWGRQLVEWDIDTGKELRVTAIDAPDWWSGNIGVAAANGEVYVAFGSGPWESGSDQLYVYDATTLQLLRAVTCGVSDSSGFGFALGKLYSSNGTTIREIDPLTGAAGPAKPITLNGEAVFVQGGLTGTDLGKLLASGGNRIVYEIDPETGWVMRTITLSGAVGDTAWLSYRSGEIIALGLKPSGVTGSSLYIMRFSAYSGARLGYTQCYASMYTDLGGDGFAPVRPVEYYRVYRDGVLISDNYVSASNFVDTSPLAGTHVYTVTAVDAAGNESPVSEGLVYPPVPPAVPHLSGTVDSGSSSSDGVTMYNNSADMPLQFVVQDVLAGDTVRVYVDDVLAGAAVATIETAFVTLNPGALADGTHVVRATRVVAGVESQPSEPGTFTVDTVAPTYVSLDLLPSSDTGISDSDNVTSVAGGVLHVDYDGVYAEVIYGVGNALNITTDTAVLPAWLPPGRNTFAAYSLDVAGNKSPRAELVIDYDAYAPLQPARPTLDGSSGSPVIGLLPAVPVQTVWVKTMTTQTPGDTANNMNMAMTEVDPTSGRILRVVPLDVPDWWQMNNISIATGNGQVYVATGTPPWVPGYGDLYVFDATSGALVRAVPCDIENFASLGFVGGKLYALMNGAIQEINPLTGAAGTPITVTLNGAPVSLYAGITGTGTRGTLIGGGGGHILYELDPATGVISRTISLLNVAGDLQGLAYRDGEIIAAGLVPAGVVNPPTNSRFDISTGAYLGGFRSPSWSSGGDLGGDAFAPVRPVEYYRVYRDGVLISDNYISASSFADPSPLDGTHSYTVTAVDAAGNESPASAPVSYTYFAPPEAPYLDPNVDTGTSINDGITMFNNSPNVPLKFRVPGTFAGDLVRLYIGGVYSGSAVATGAITDVTLNPGIVADGTHVVRATRSTWSGLISPQSAPGTFTVDTVAPAAPAMPDLLPESDSGISNSDNVTNVSNPRIHIPFSDSTIRLWCLNNSFLPDGDGNVTLQFLAPGTNPIYAQSVDAAGNMSPYSPLLLVNYDWAAPLKPSAPQLDPGSGSQPVLNLSPAAPVATGWALIWAPVPDTTEQWKRTLIEWDVDSGQLLRSVRIDAADWWSYNIGVAAGNGEVYVAFGSGPWGPGYNQLYVYDATSLELKRAVDCGVSDSAGFAFVNGKLYSSNGWSLTEINPLTGAAGPAVPITLNGQSVSLQQGLTGAPDRGTLFATPGGKTVYEIDPVTGAVVNTITLSGVVGDNPYLSYRSGELVAMGLQPDDVYSEPYSTYVIRFDPASGARTGWASAGAYVLPYNDLGGDGYAPTRPEEYYRVYRDGVQISDDYVSGSSFTDESPLTGTHIYTVFAADAAGNLSPASDAFVINPEAAVTIPDAALQAAIRQALNKPTGDITVTDMASLTSLSAEWSGVRNLSGLEYAVNLQELNLEGNQVSDLTPLSVLLGLSWLDVSYNNLDISAGSEAMAIIEFLQSRGASVSYQPQNG